MTQFEDVLETILEEYARRDSEGDFDTWEETDAFVKEKAEVLLAYVKEEPVSEEFKIALEKKVREAQDWTYIEEEGGECPLNEEFGACDLEEFARWGANWQKEQMMANAVDAQCFGFQCGALFSFRLPASNYLVGSEVKVIVIKK